jgi:hypothetical protein
MEPIYRAIPLSLAGGGGMASTSLLERLGPYFVWGWLMLMVCGIAVSVLRKLYRAPTDRQDDDGE